MPIDRWFSGRGPREHFSGVSSYENLAASRILCMKNSRQRTEGKLSGSPIVSSVQFALRWRYERFREGLHCEAEAEAEQRDRDDREREGV